MSRHFIWSFGVAALVTLSGCSNAPLGEDAAVVSRLKTADSAVVERRYVKPESGKTYLRILTHGPEETQQLVVAMLSAKRDRHSYGDSATRNTVKFYCKTEPLVKIDTGGDVFVINDTQYKAQSQVLSKLVDEPLDAASEMEVKSR